MFGIPIERMDDPCGVMTQAQLDDEYAATVNRRFHGIFGAKLLIAEDIDALKPLKIVPARRLDGTLIAGCFELED